MNVYAIKFSFTKDFIPSRSITFRTLVDASLISLKSYFPIKNEAEKFVYGSHFKGDKLIHYLSCQKAVAEYTKLGDVLLSAPLKILFSELFNF